MVNGNVSFQCVKLLKAPSGCARLRGSPHRRRTLYHKGVGRSGSSAGYLNVERRNAKRSKCLYYFFKGGAELSFPPDWPNLTEIDVHPWQPRNQSAKSNRKSSEGLDWLFLPL